MKTHNIKFISGIFMSAAMLLSCSGDDIATRDGNNSGERGAEVTFQVSQAQDEMRHQASSDMPLTRTAFERQISPLGLTPEDLTSQKLAVSGGDGSICLIETTTAGIDPVKPQAVQDSLSGASTRAEITKMSTFGHF